MTRVHLVVTGKAEEELPTALARVFPDGKFTAERWVNADGNSEGGFTSNRLRPTGRTQRAQRLLGDLVGNVQRGGVADYSIFVDDLELANLACEEDVCAYFRAAATELAETKSHRTRMDLRERVSVHLLAPMLEAYFFTDPDCWAAAGITSARPRRLVAGVPESFGTRDPSFLRSSASSAFSRWDTPYRCLHPKQYLIYLVDKGGGEYRETSEGRAALAGLDLRRSWSSPNAQWALVGALLDDVAAMLGVTSPTVHAKTQPAVTSHLNGTVLRNV